MRSIVSLVGLLIVATVLSGCQGASSSGSIEPPICSPRAQDAGHCYGIAIPARAGV